MEGALVRTAQACAVDNDEIIIANFHLIYWTVLLTALHIMNKLITRSIAINFCIVFLPQLIYAYHVITSIPSLFLGGINMFVAAEHLQARSMGRCWLS